MKSDDHYRTIAAASEGNFRDRGSKFIGYAFPVNDEEQIKEHLQQLKKLHPSCRHVCYAFRINPLNEYWRANDDGEPSSSAGKPILGQIRSLELQNVLVAVVRYFGGTLLGVPGLINAYREAAAEALQAAEIVEKIVTVPVTAQVGYEKMGDVMKWVKDSRYEYNSPLMEDQFSITLHVPARTANEVIMLFVENNWLKEDSAAGE